MPEMGVIKEDNLEKPTKVCLAGAIHSSKHNSTRQIFFPTTWDQALQCASSTFRNGANVNRKRRVKANMKMVHQNKDEKTTEELGISADLNVEESSTNCKKTKVSSLLETENVVSKPRPSFELQDGGEESKAKLKMVSNLENRDEKTVGKLGISTEQNIEESSTHWNKTKFLSLSETRCVAKEPRPSSTLQDGAKAERREKRKTRIEKGQNLENKDEKTLEALGISAEQNAEESPAHCKETKSLSLLETRCDAKEPRPSSKNAERREKRKTRMGMAQNLEKKDEKTIEELGVSAEQKVEKSPSHWKNTNALSLLETGDVAECSRSHSLENINTQGEQSDVCASPGRAFPVKIRRKLLVLDLNGLLVDIISFVPQGYIADTKISNKSLFKRPFCDDFLKFCFEKFNIGVWSSRHKMNVDRVVDYIMGDMKSNLLFCWDQSHCSHTGFSTVEDAHKPLFLKELRKLWDKHDPNLPWEIGEFNQSNTLLLDDSPHKALRNPPNTAIFPPSYDFQDANDNSLGPDGNIRIYLEGLAMADDVQKYVEQNPFGQRPISNRNPSWPFYLKIIGDDQSCK